MSDSFDTWKRQAPPEPPWQREAERVSDAIDALSDATIDLLRASGEQDFTSFAADVKLIAEQLERI